MYPNLRAEMAREKITWSKLAEILHVRPATLTWKNQGKTSFTLDEAFEIKTALGTDLPLEELFKREDD